MLLSNLILIALSTESFGQNLQWTKQIGSAGWDEGTSIKTDQNNQVYTVGLFIGTVDFDPGTGVFNLTSVGEKDAFVCKFDAAGNFIWAKQYGDSAAIDEKSSLDIDASGNLYITNSFLGTVDFDPGAGSFNLTSQGVDRDVFVQKLDPDGNFIWAKQIGGPFVPSFPTPAHSNAISVDPSGNLYLTGYFDGTIDFDPDATLTFNMTSQFNASDVFICKLNSDGDFVWAKQFTGTLSNGGVGYAIDVDDSGNVYSTGTIGGGVDFDPGPGTFYLNQSVSLQTEIYLSKLDASGNFVWAKAMGPGDGSAILVDGNSNVYSSGWTPSGYIAAINKHDSAGNLLWAKELGGLSGESIALDNNGNVYTAGLCFGTNDFDPGPGVFNLTGGSSDSYISKLDSSGNFIWAGLLTGTDQVWVNSIDTDTNNNVYTIGYFDGTADFDPSATVFNLTAPAMAYDIFIHKLSTNVVAGITQNSFEEEITIYPNPTEGELVIEFAKEKDDLDLVLRNSFGQVINTKFISTEKGIELQINGESGIYLLEVSDDNNHKAVLKIIKK
ncbi:T9SS type A sorting domain-containing protein [Fluviicola sp.]|uniref:T9SS type A sorting domain-containing protein n=1 Tax=Fluviicola sp. TaxID=1917219 RepID=UPI00261991F8|nr:T9SS type A sorting domain-containing protein [Fluviicola sp.]